MGELLETIKEARRELEELERQYVNETESCYNTKCTFYNTKCSLNCHWTTLVEECREYLDEDKE